VITSSHYINNVIRGRHFSTKRVKREQIALRRRPGLVLSLTIISGRFSLPRLLTSPTVHSGN
jgi:hypothetical protein